MEHNAPTYPTDRYALYLTWLNIAFWAALCIFVFSFPFSIAITSIAIPGLMLIFVLDHRNLKKNARLYISDIRNRCLLLVFFMLLISVFYSVDTDRAIHEIVKYLPLALLPLALIKVKDLSDRQIETVKYVHIITCCVGGLYALLRGLQDAGVWDESYKELAAPELWRSYIIHRITYHQLSAHLHLHAIYFSLFIALACLFIVDKLMTGKARYKGLLLPVLLFLLMLLLLLKSSSVNFGFYSIVLGYLLLRFSFQQWRHYLVFLGGALFAVIAVFYLYTLKSTSGFSEGIYLFDDAAINKKLLIAIGAVFTAALAAIAIKRLFNKHYRTILISLIVLAVAGLAINKLQKDTVDRPNEETTNVDARFESWTAAAQLISKHIFFGVGVGDEESALIAQYRQTGFTAGIDNRFDAHNQYFQFWIAAGIFCALAFVALLLILITRAIKGNNFPLFGFIYCFAILCLSDSILTAQSGRLFFLLFICLLDSRKPALSPSKAVE